MSKYKITSLITGALITASLVVGGSYITIKNIPKNNTILLTTASTSTKNNAVVINSSNTPLVLYSNANTTSSISSYISVGEMLTINASNSDFYYVTVKETGARGYIEKSNAQIIESGVNRSITNVNKKGSIINVSSIVYLRSNATMSSKPVANLMDSTDINIISKQGDWYKVKTDSDTGYVYSAYVGLTNQDIPTNTSDSLNKTATQSQQPYTNNNSDVVIKTLPDWNSKSVTTIKHEAVPVKVISSSNGWDKVELPNGKTGYIQSSSIINRIINNGNNIANAATSAVNAANNVGNSISSIISSTSSAITSFNNGVSSIAQNKANNAKDISNNIKSNVKSTTQNVNNIGNQVASNIQNASNTANHISSTASNAANNITNTVNNINNNAKNTASNIASTASNINNNINSAANHINNHLNNVNNAINSANTKIANDVHKVANTVDGINTNIKNFNNNIKNFNNQLNNLN
ncbi:MAG: SH3 domain-containing protein [Sarcina sp.]